MKNVCCYHFKNFLTKLCWNNQYRWFFLQQGISALQESFFLFLMKIHEQGFQTWKNSKKQQTHKISLKNSWVIYYNNYLFHEDVVNYQCTLMFSKKDWFEDWLWGGLIHLNLYLALQEDTWKNLGAFWDCLLSTWECCPSATMEHWGKGFKKNGKLSTFCG